MKITRISTKSSRTFEIPGVAGRSKYLKVESFAEAEIQAKDDPKKAYMELADFVDRALQYEIEKMKKPIKLNNKVNNMLV